MLNSTGASGGLTVSGNGGRCTFAAADVHRREHRQYDARDAVSLTSTFNPSLSLMNIHDGAGNGVRL